MDDNKIWVLVNAIDRLATAQNRANDLKEAELKLKYGESISRQVLTTTQDINKKNR